MRISIHDSAANPLRELSETLGLSPSQIIKHLSQAYNNHINKGQPLELQGVRYERTKEG